MDKLKMEIDYNVEKLREAIATKKKNGTGGGVVNRI